MALVDDRGRLFGRFNLVDAVVALFVIGLIPLLYGAATLFWSPLPVLTSIEPASIARQPGMRIRVMGEHLRPYLRVSFGDVQGKDFLFRSTREAEVNLNDMAPGTYDVILYDSAQERGRLVKGLTITTAPMPPTQMTLIGMFGNLDAERAKQLTAGTTIDGVGIIRKVGEPIPAAVRVNANGLIVQIPIERAVMLPAEVEAGCEVQPAQGVPFCQQNGIVLQPTIVLFGNHALGKLPFQIDQIRGRAPLSEIEVVVRLAGAPQVIAAVRLGDADRGLYYNPLASGATVTAVRPAANAQLDVTLRLQAERGSNGWIYASTPLRAGATFALRTARYELAGNVLTVSPEWAPAR
jgi:hypothetical protein